MVLLLVTILELLKPTPSYASFDSSGVRYYSTGRYKGKSCCYYMGTRLAIGLLFAGFVAYCSFKAWWTGWLRRYR